MYAAKGNTRGLLNVASRSLEINPKDLVAQNNVVLLSLLLNSNVERAQALADDAHRQQPNNQVIASTYAYALYLRGKTDDAIKVMRSLDEKLLADPSCAAYFAAMLVDSETPSEAEKYIEIALAGKVLPEELALVKAAREALIRRGASGGQTAKP
jgi:predicted Zn-dependent protease